MSEPIITPEVLAALNTVRESRREWPEPSGQEYTPLERAEVILANAMLSLFPPNMPQPREAFADVPTLLAEIDRLRAEVSRLTNANAHLQQELNFLRRRPE